MMDIQVTKGILLGTMFVLTFFFMMIPLKLMSALKHAWNPHEKSRYARIISLLNCFAGGVFLGTCLLDLFPEVNDKFYQVQKHLGFEVRFPLAEFCLAFGFFLVLMAEQLVLYYKELSWSPDDRPILSRQNSNSSNFSVNSAPPDFQLSHEGPLAGINDRPCFSLSHKHAQKTGECLNEEARRQGQDSRAGSVEKSMAVELALQVHSTHRLMLLLLALSLHSVFEGLAIGLQPNIEDVVRLFVAVAMHKSLIAFSLGLNFVQSKLALSRLLQATILFSITAPFGMGIGMLLDQFSSGTPAVIVSAILQGLACGTFLYVTFFEVLPHELNTPHDRPFKLLFLIFGFSLVCSVVFLDPN